MGIPKTVRFNEELRLRVEEYLHRNRIKFWGIYCRSEQCNNKR